VEVMGMDLIPKNKKLEPAYLNWTAWETLRVFLERLSFPNMLANSNDADCLSYSECRDIASSIKRDLPILLEVGKEVYRERNIEESESDIDAGPFR
jgi:hypothetical protein